MVLDGRCIQVPGGETGYYLGPTLFDNVTTDMALYKEEVFGPVRGVMRPTSFDEAIAITNTPRVRQRRGDLHPRRQIGAPLRGRSRGRE